MTDGARQRSRTSDSAKDAAAEQESGGGGGGGVALKKEIGLVSACGIIVGECGAYREATIGQSSKCAHKHFAAMKSPRRASGDA